jgi:ABC-type multidrug transport system fused ATPase/permease subunit
VVREPEIYLFDDSFSALDFRTDANLRAALAEETQDSTVLIVAQRVNTIRRADKIIVLEAGRVVGEGTHEELLLSCSVYKEIAASQLSEEELADELAHLGSPSSHGKGPQ